MISSSCAKEFDTFFGIILVVGVRSNKEEKWKNKK
jgi:hypothetical protein